jgi:predicted nucleic acid-binding protein
LSALRAARDQVVVNDLTRLECRVKPIQLNDPQRLAKFDGFFAQTDVLKAPLTRAVYDRATLIRAQYAFKTLDAIHLAAAIEADCDAFLTHDTLLARFTDLPVEVLP